MHSKRRGTGISEQIKYKKNRFLRFLKWLGAQKGVTKYQIKEWFFDNYALSERTIERDLRDLVNYSYVIVKGTKFYVNKLKKPLW